MSDVHVHPDSVTILIRTGDRLQTLELIADENGMVKPKVLMEVGRDSVEVDPIDLLTPLWRIIPSGEVNIALKVSCGRALYSDTAAEVSTDVG
jgi:hypothetical protein